MLLLAGLSKTASESAGWNDEKKLIVQNIQNDFSSAQWQHLLHQNLLT